MYKYKVGDKFIFSTTHRQGRIFEVVELQINNFIFGKSYMLKELYNRKEKDVKPWPVYYIDSNTVLYTKETKILYGDNHEKTT